MSNQIREADWKVLRELMPIALERFCERVLSEVCTVALETGKSARRYLAVFKLIHRRDDEMADAFNDVRRSRAMLRLACIKFLDVLTEEELARFSPETREHVEVLVETLLS